MDIEVNFEQFHVEDTTPSVLEKNHNKNNGEDGVAFSVLWKNKNRRGVMITYPSPQMNKALSSYRLNQEC
jgi:hypothetical protein